MTETHVDLPGSRRPAKPGARRVREMDPHAIIEITLDLRAPPLPKRHNAQAKALSRAKFAVRYGAKPDDAHMVRRVLRGFGLHVTGTAFGGRSLHVRGTAAAIEAAFAPDMAIYTAPDQGEYRGRSGTIKLPSALQGVVTGAFGLDQRRMMRRRHGRTAGAAGKNGLDPKTLEQHYGFPEGTARGQTIAIAEFGEAPQGGGDDVPPAYFPDDVATFCADNGRAAPSVAIVPAGLLPLTPEQYSALPPRQRKASEDASREAMMDIEIIAALAPGATINVYYGKSSEQGWIDLLDAVIDAAGAAPVAFSISWGDPEDSANWSSAALAAIDSRMQALAAMGVTICVAAGDDGSSDGATDPGLHVDFPASSPHCLAVGGTMLTDSGDEVVWWQTPGTRNGGGGATGGGVSTEFPRPDWQTVDVAPLGSLPFAGRIIPDVAALAGPPGYAVRLFGKDTSLGGTSASAPLWAALLARINAALPAANRHRFVTPLLYQATAAGPTAGAAGSSDIVTGDNRSDPDPGVGYAAAAGFDAVSGWGVPAGKALLAALASLPPPTA